MEWRHMAVGKRAFASEWLMAPKLSCEFVGRRAKRQLERHVAKAPRLDGLRWRRKANLSLASRLGAGLWVTLQPKWAQLMVKLAV